MDDEFAGATNGQQFSDVKANYEVKTNMKDIEVPVKGGSPAFSIHASKVYILYPSLFQDPNIFGRFTIPQNINLDPVPDKQITKTADFSNDQPQILQPKTNPTKSVNSNPYNPYKTNNNRRPKRQQADGPSSDRKQNDEENNKKRNVETHLTGTIVVLNQDVNEVNRKDAY